MNPIRFNELSNPLKVGMVSAWFIGALYLLIFLYGFIQGFVGYGG